MKNENYATASAAQIRLARRSPAYWRVTFDHPPLNIFGPETIPQLNEIITTLETDKDVKVVVFDSAVEGFFLTHYNFLARIEDTTRQPPGRTGWQPFPTCSCGSVVPRWYRSRQFAGAQPVSEVSLRSPATCASRAAKKRSCRNGKWELLCVREGDQWQ